MALNTRIRGQQLNLDDAGIDVTADSLAFNDATDDAVKMETIDDFVTAIAGSGLANDTSQLKVDLNELGAGVVDVSADSIAIVDADDDVSKKESIADLVAGMAGTGLSASSGAMAIDLNGLGVGVIDVSADSIVFIDADDDGSKKESVADLATGMAGNGLSASSGALAVDLNELNTEGTFDPNADFVGIVDATDSSSDKTLWSVIATAIAGSGITATNGVLSADAVADNIVEADIQKEDESGNCNGANTTFTLTSTPVTNSVQVFLNGLLQQEGSGKDYTLSGTTVEFTTAPLTGDILIVHYLIND
jgi:hypothetical protein